MALVLDTRDVAEEHRQQSVHDAFIRAEVPRRVLLTTPPAAGTTRIETWTFGATKVFCPESPGLKVVRTPTLGPLEPIVVLCLQNRGTAQLVQDGQQRRLIPGELVMPGPVSSNEFVINGVTTAFEIPFGEVGLPFETAQRASERLAGSALLPLVTHHLLSLRHDAEQVSASAAAPSVGVATTHLVRALIVSAADDDRYQRAVLADALVPRILAYARLHLADQDLTPATVARAHNISVRYLYKLCDAAGVRLVEWIMHERLEGARRDLTAPEHTPESISLISRRWGFKDPSHFSTRFRRAYEVSPRDVRRRSRLEFRDRL